MSSNTAYLHLQYKAAFNQAAWGQAWLHVGTANW